MRAMLSRAEPSTREGNSVRGRNGRGTSIPGTYNVGGRRVLKTTVENRDSSRWNR